MTITDEQVWAEVERVSAAEAVTEPVAAMRVMTLAVMAVARHVPGPLRGGLADACSRWFAGRADLVPLEPARVAAWRFLEEKNGSSVTVADRTDAVVRALICVLWDEAEKADLDLTIEAFVGFVNRVGPVEHTVGQ